LNAARRIREPNYDLAHFYEDCVSAFPELALYVSDPTGAAISGNTLDEEYQRTIGALFSFYWLMRLHLDGAQQFCFGVDQKWKTLSSASEVPIRSDEERKKRQTAMEQIQWKKFEAVLVSAGILTVSGSPPRVSGHSVDRTLGMLVLTAIHDIMKVAALVPTVQEAHKEFCGYQAGDTIGDHDIALGYILNFYPGALPSFQKLPLEQQATVKFTQCKMEYNMGWLVQGEAPPGALFSKFKETILSGHAKPEDVAFYFTHWLTDLAGAEPYPQEGCEKFVLRFPQKILGTFLDSIPIVSELSGQTETRVYESYLQWRWRTHEPTIGNVPNGTGSIAKMRIVIMAQGDSASFLEALDELSSTDYEILQREMSLCGCKNQEYASEHQMMSGPAFLVYYAPALLQKAGAADPLGALEALADIYDNARGLFPAGDKDCEDCVTIRIDAIKNLTVQEIRAVTAKPGDVWILERTSGKEGQIRKANLMQDADTIQWPKTKVLFSRQEEDQDDFEFGHQTSITSGSSGGPARRRRRTGINTLKASGRRRRTSQIPCALQA